MIGDPELFHIVQHGLDFCKQHLVELICRAIAVKIRIVESDPYEQGVRATLNLGHTIGHAVEKASGYRLLHGEAVSIGMVAESILAETLGIARQGLTQELISVLSGMGLPVFVPEDISEGEIIKAMKVDKKKAAGAILFALPVDVGSVKAGVEISDLESVLKSGSRENIQNFIRQSTAREAS
jgi:3-dehydroquinate synthetase